MKRGEVRRDFLPRVSSKYTFSDSNVKQLDISECNNCLVNVQRLEEIPPLSTCLSLRAKLTAKEVEGSDNCLDLTVNRSHKFVVDIEGLGKLDRDGIQEIVALHNQHRVVREVYEEKLWFEKMKMHLSSNTGLISLQKPVENFVNELWLSEENGKVLGVDVKDAMRLLCNRWFTDDLIEFFFRKFNTASEEHAFIIFDQSMNDASIFLQRVLRVLKPKTKYLHFALNVKCCATDMKSTAKTTIGNGNHWVYVLITCDGENIIYGDPKGWNVPQNLRACFEPLMMMLQERNSGSKHQCAVRLVNMHIPQSGIAHHVCVGGCSTLFPVQTCYNLCGGIVVLISSAAILAQDLWQEIIFGEKCHCNSKYSLLRSLIKDPSSHSLTLRGLMIAWLTKDNILEYGFQPLLESSNVLPKHFDYDLDFPPLQSGEKDASSEQRLKGKSNVMNFA